MPEEKPLNELTDIEISNKISNLNAIVYSTNFNLARQAYPILEMYYAEQDMRVSKKLEDYMKSKKTAVSPDEPINIGYL